MSKLSTNKIAIAILLGSFMIAVAVLFSTAIQLMTSKSSPNAQSEKVFQNISLIKTSGSPYLGNPQAPVTVIEYIDFECPVCKKVYEDIMPPLKTDYINTNKVKFVFKSMPIEDFHKTTYVKTEAALCAFGQGGNSAFFAYHDELFKDFYEANIDNGLISIARQINLDPVQFTDCLNKHTFKPLIEKDKIEAIAISANGTPTWLIGKTAANGGISDTIKINGLHKYEIYKTIIDHLLENE